VIDWREKYEEVCRQLEELTPKGSEFYNDPKRCLDWIRVCRDSDRKLIKRMMRRINSSRRLRRLWEKAGRKEARRARLQKD